MLGYDNVKTEVDARSKIKPEEEFKNKSKPVMSDIQRCNWWVITIRVLIVEVENKALFCFKCYHYGNKYSNVGKLKHVKTPTDHSQVNMVASSQNLILKDV